MTALTQDRDTQRRDGVQFSDPVAAAVIIYVGAMYALNASGNAVPATAAGTTVRAIAQQQASVAAGDERIEGRVGTFRVANSIGAGAIARDDINSVAYVVDDQTVSTTGTAVAGLIVDVDEGGVWVDVSQAGAIAAAIAAAA